MSDERQNPAGLDPPGHVENPFQSPTADSAASGRKSPTLVGPLDQDDNVWQYGNLLLVRRGTELPDRCVVCNEASDPQRLVCVVRQRLATWISIILLVLMGPLFLLVVTMCMPTARLQPGLCPSHRAKEKTYRLVSLVLSLLAVSLIIGPWMFLHSGLSIEWVVILMLAGIPVVFFVVLWVVFRTRPLRANKIDDEFIWLEGVHPEYIASYGNEPGQA